jgi:hypothetical protein
MARIRGPARALCTLGSALLILSGCDQFSSGGDAQFARAALERNPDLTIVASDKDANTFTVQVKGSNELRVVRADEIIGALPSTAVAPAISEGAETAKASPGPQAAPESGSAEPSQTDATADDAARPAGQLASTQARTGLKSGTGFVTDASGKTRTFGAAESPAGVDANAESSTSARTAASATPADQATGADQGAGAGQGNDPSKAGDAQKSSAEGRVLASGPGYSVTAGAPRANRPIRLAEATELKSPSNAVLERRFDPMICQGNRLLQIDSRNIEFEGDGLSVLDGCELHITNSHIIAHGLGLSVRAANVHIQNSIIEGGGGSVSASQGAKVYSQQSTFKGLSRRLDTATFEDLGGTSWD